MKTETKQKHIKVICSECGKIGLGRKPKNGDGSLLYPRWHYNGDKPCHGCFVEAEWVKEVKTSEA